MALQVMQELDKQQVRDLVKNYFSKTRAALQDRGLNEDSLSALDNAMQDLLRCAQQRSRVDQYRDRIKSCIKALAELEVRLLQLSQVASATPHFGQREQRILETLHKVNHSAAAAFEQGLDDLRIAERKSWRGTILEFREALRETLDTLAPDADVEKEPNFQLRPNAKRPTMTQKAVFIFRNRNRKGSQTKPAEDAIGAVDNIVADIVRSVYDRASTGVHTSVGREEARSVKEWVTTVLAELLEIGD
jgi:hypothetical protein